MSNRVANQIFLYLTLIFIFLFFPQKANAEVQIWHLNSTSDCSGQGGDGKSFSALCYNIEGVNSTTQWMHSNDPAVHFDVIPGHQYTFSEVTNFSGSGSNFISNYLTDGNGYDYGQGSDWICPTSGCAHGSWSKTFEAKGADLYFLQASACSLSTDCYTTDITLIDLSIPKVPAINPAMIWNLETTSDCSYTGNSTAPCYNTNGTNITVGGKPAISIQIVTGHTYSFTETTPFIGVGGDFISNLLTDGDGYDYGLGSDWICPTTECYHGSWGKIFTAHSDKLIFVQNSSCTLSSNCFTSNLQLNDLSAPDPLPSPTPVSKVIFAPGFGGSWNPSAFANCTLDLNSENWSLASYAEGAYNPIINAISDSGWNLKQFYYDWRAPISANSNQLSTIIDSFTDSDEKINIVGHSMGGLVASKYLMSDQGKKTNSLLTVGSPFRGVPISYPAWSGGEIWDDNFLTKIAINLYLRHCGGLNSNRIVIQNQFPSLNNLLPVFNYLKKNKNLVTWESMSAKNELLPIQFDSNFWGIKFGTLTGTGFSTLAQIPVKDPSSKDIKSGNWTDGKPYGKTYSYNGDGTALLSSTKYDEDHNITIGQNHQGLINSVPGMTEVLKFLGTSPSIQNITQGTTATDLKSSLIIISYPGNFWVTDVSGKTRKDKNGMIAYDNPKSGEYKLNIIPSNPNTLVVVAQFLPSGEVFYKEYKLSNLLPKNKILKFDLNNPNEDILK